MYLRSISSGFKKSALHHFVIGLTGPRGVGKTDLAISTQPHHFHVNLEDPVVRSRILKDIPLFLKDLPKERIVILDEVQFLPELVESLVALCKRDENLQGRFCVISSLASALEPLNELAPGMYRQWKLWPLSLEELGEGVPLNLDSLLYQGTYPKLHLDFLFPGDFNRERINEYLSKDLPLQTKVHDQNVFHRFLGLCAEQSGEIVNYSKLGALSGVSYNTAKHWLKLLVDAQLVFLLAPFKEGFGKRVVKSPKLYFVDSGLLCYLLGIKSLGEIKGHPKRSGVFESFVVSESYKIFQQKGINERCHFWRDKLGRDIALLIEKGEKIHPIDILSKEYIEDLDFNDISRWKRWAYGQTGDAWVTYMGQATISQDQATVIPWYSLSDVLSTV